MPQPILHFSHANGFPAPCYRKYLDALAADYQVGFIESIGENPRYPVTDGFPHLVDELIAHISSHYAQPVIGVGHSMGGHITLMAAVRRPELFRAVVVLDATFLAGFKSRAYGLVKRLGLIERLGPAGATRRRRSSWADIGQARAYLQGRRAYARLDPDCLEDFVRLGMVENEQEVRLRISPEAEARLYAAMPHDFSAYRGKLTVPGGYIGARQSEYAPHTSRNRLRRDFGLKCEQMEGSHMFVLEQPEEAARQTRELIQALLPG
jgi:pimeloyl-ACP methyl ester carboxylesterase